MDNVRRTLYDVIGVASIASQDAIEEACLRLSEECRADKSLDAQTAARLLADVEEVRATLADPDKRARYDAELALEIDWDKRAQHAAEVLRDKKIEENLVPAPKHGLVEEPLSNRGLLVVFTIVAIVVAVLGLGAVFKWIQEPSSGDFLAVPALRARVTDLTGTLNSQQRSALEKTLAQFEARRGSQIAVLIVPSTKPETVEQYAARIEEAWKLGRKGIDDGVLLLVAKDDRRLRIEVGYGLEGVLTDAVAKRIIEDDIVPSFKRNDFYGGILTGIEHIIRVSERQKLPPPVAGGTRSGEPFQPSPAGAEIWYFWFSLEGIRLFLQLVFVILVIACVLTFLGQFLCAATTGGVTGYIAFGNGEPLFSALLWAALACAISFYCYPLTRDLFWSMVLPSEGSSDGGWSGGGGGGGYSGGGGGSGGGGASGSW